MARPQIPDQLKEEVEQIHKKHREYDASSFQEALGTVTDVAEGRRQTSNSSAKSNSDSKPRNIEDPVERAVELDITHPDDIPSPHGERQDRHAGYGDITKLLGVPPTLRGIFAVSGPPPQRQISEKAVYTTQEAVKTLRQREAEGEIGSHTADRLVETYRKALRRYVAAERENRERLEGSYRATDDLEAAIVDFLRENYVEDEELEGKTGFQDFETAADALVEPVLSRLDVP